MPYQYDIDPAHAIGTVKLTGRITTAVFLQSMEEMFGDDRWQPGFRTLYDLRNISELLIDITDLDKIAASVARLEPVMGAGKAAFVVARALDDSIARLLIFRTQKTTHRERRVFYDLEEARQWLAQG